MEEKHSQIYEFDGFSVDAGKRLFYGREDEPLALTPKVFDTLLYLVRNNQRVIGKDELMREIWTDTIVEENSLNKNISILRQVLGEKKNEHRYIVTVPGRGYKFVAPVRISEFKFQVPSSGDSLEIENSQDDKIHNSQPKNQKPEPKNQKPKLIILLIVLSVFAIGATGVYFWRGGEKSTNASVKTIAVLPFKPLTLENRNTALELGMADALINKISSSAEIVVRPLGSIRRYSNLEQDVLQAGRELGADAVLEGTIQMAGERIRVSARLIRTNDGRQLWTETFDEKFTDIFAVQDSISNKVLSALTLKLSGEAQNRMTRRGTENAEAYQLYMKGRFHAAQLILPEARKGLEYYNQAIALDPNYALAYVGIAQAHLAFSLSGDVAPSEAMPKGKAAAVKALELDPNLPEAQVAVGFFAFWFDWNWTEAEKKYQRALELDPYNAAAHYFYAHLNSNLGRHTEALEQVRRAREFDPLSLLTNSVEGQFLFYAGFPDEAVSRLNKTLELEPNFWHSHLVLSEIYAEQQKFDEAVAAATRAAQISGGHSSAAAMKGYALAKSGDINGARTVLAELQKSPAEKYVPPYNLAVIYDALGESETALDLLEKAFTEKNVQIVFLKVDPKWNNLRGNSRFQNLMMRLKLN